MPFQTVQRPANRRNVQNRLAEGQEVPEKGGDGQALTRNERLKQPVITKAARKSWKRPEHHRNSQKITERAQKSLKRPENNRCVRKIHQKQPENDRCGQKMHRNSQCHSATRLEKGQNQPENDQYSQNHPSSQKRDGQARRSPHAARKLRKQLASHTRAERARKAPKWREKKHQNSQKASKQPVKGPNSQKIMDTARKAGGSSQNRSNLEFRPIPMKTASLRHYQTKQSFPARITQNSISGPKHPTKTGFSGQNQLKTGF